MASAWRSTPANIDHPATPLMGSSHPTSLVAGPLATLEHRFSQRVRSPRAWFAVAFALPRFRLMLALAAAPAALLLVAGLLYDPLARGVTEPERVRQVFSRYVSAIATASTLAVAFASLAMKRGIKGVGEIREHVDADERFRDEVRTRGKHDRLPVDLGGFLGVALDDVARAAAHARSRASPEDLADEAYGVRMGPALDAIERSARRAASDARRASRDPDELLHAALDFEHDVSAHLARCWARDPRISASARAAMEELSAALRALGVGRNYTKTLATQWGLSRMSHAIIASSFGAILAATFMALWYEEGVREAIGAAGGLGVLCAALFVAILPLAAFVSYAMRFVFLNEHSLPLGSFVLGPETGALPGEPTGVRSRRATPRA